MKKTILIGGVILSIVMGASAFDYLEVTAVRPSNGSTVVSYTRYSTEVLNGAEHVFFTWDNTYRGTLSVQEAINKGTYIVDDNATVTSRVSGTVAKAGVVNTFATLRYNAYVNGGLSGYFTELARQIALSM